MIGLFYGIWRAGNLNLASDVWVCESELRGSEHNVLRGGSQYRVDTGGPGRLIAWFHTIFTRYPKDTMCRRRHSVIWDMIIFMGLATLENCVNWQGRRSCVQGWWYGRYFGKSIKVCQASLFFIGSSVYFQLFKSPANNMNYRVLNDHTHKSRTRTYNLQR